MQAEIFLVAPLDADPDSFPHLLKDVLAAAPIAALLLPKAGHDDKNYAALVKAVLPVAQIDDCAVLLDNEPALAKELGADGVHMSSGIKQFREALQMLKPDFIVGAGAIQSHHDAMTKGDAGADYIFFGPLTGAADPAAAEAAHWWAETFEVPAVYCNPGVNPVAAHQPGCEFIAFSQGVWTAPEGAANALAQFTGKLETQ